MNIGVGIEELTYHILQSRKVSFASLKQFNENKAEEERKGATEDKWNVKKIQSCASQEQQRTDFLAEGKLSLDWTVIGIRIYGTIFLALGFFTWCLVPSCWFIIISLTIQGLDLLVQGAAMSFKLCLLLRQPLQYWFEAIAFNSVNCGSVWAFWWYNVAWMLTRMSHVNENDMSLLF